MFDERIDKYVTGKMSEEERLLFERELAGNPGLQEEVSLQRDIVRAIRMKAAKEHLQRVEHGIQARTRRRKIFRIVINVSSFAAAACLAIGLFVHVERVSDYKAVGNRIELTAESVRGGEKTSTAILEAIGHNDYEVALELIAQEESREFSSQFTHPDLIEQDRLEYAFEQESLQWYKAVVYMRMGKWIKARRVLKRIAASDSHYKSQAQSELEQL
ncbi:hypothetical protein [Alistipes sp.]|uniref:hypothetical protein n=1 Tax=Alistipes sp. TaxID=1872444 RepID=UPI0011DCC439|nr:hypothetical protein [Alistipes sp.]